MTNAQQCLHDALKLTADERAFLVDALLDSLEDRRQVADAWDAEIKRRIADLDEGRVRGIPWNEARQAIFGP